MSKKLSILMGALALSLASVASVSAQCASDDDCAEGERCNVGLVLACEAPCDEPAEGAGDGAEGTCVSAMLGEACGENGDCGEGLVCTHLLVATDCPADDDECSAGGSEQAEGFCSEEGNDAMLAASSGLAPEPSAAAADPSAESGPAVDDGDSSGESGAKSGGCSVGGSPTGSLAWIAMVGLCLAGRRRSLRAR